MADCPAHPGTPALGTCERCGRFFCAADRLELDGKVYCAECGARPDVDWLGAHYAPFVGRRSALAWFLGVFGLALLCVGLLILSGGRPATHWGGIALAFVTYAAACLGFFTGWRHGRRALVLGSLVGAVLIGATMSEMPGGLALAIALLIVSASAWTDVRSKLFYRLPVPRPELRKHFDRQGSNPLAILASRLALFAVLVPGLGLITLGLGVLALTRVDKRATPPVGNVSAGISAIVASLLSLALWVGVYLSRNR